MTTPTNVNCDMFDNEADELALDLVAEPRRSQLLTHAAGCARCQSLLDGLGTVGDRLLLMAPEIEPPARFESRAIARMGIDPDTRSSRRLVTWTRAAALIIAVTLGVAAGWALHSDRSSAPDAAPLINTDQEQVGTVRLVAEPRPHVLVTIAAPRPGNGVRTCELQRPDGTWVAVGSWTIDEIQSGVWAVGIDPALLDATAMRVTAEDGSVRSGATFD